MVKIQELIKRCEQEVNLYNMGIVSDYSAFRYIKTNVFCNCITDDLASLLLHDCDYAHIEDEYNIELIEIDHRLGSTTRYMTNSEERCMLKIYQIAVERKLSVKATGCDKYVLYDNDKAALEYVIHKIDEVIVLD